MKTTYPSRWKAEKRYSKEIVKGQTLTTDGCGSYGISTLSRVQCCLMHMDGIDIKSDTVFWKCGECKEWNHRKEIKCNHCYAVLYKFKDEKDI